MIKSPIKWAGGKSWLFPKLQRLFDESGAIRFFEPMCGSAVLSMNIKCDGVRLANDKNPHLINMFHHLQQGLVINGAGFMMTKEEYYEIRSNFNKGGNPRDMAVWFYYLNRAGFNGLYRENKKGEFNVPWGKRKNIKDIELDVYGAISDVIFVNFDYYNIAPFQDSLIYIDPPYHETFTQYTAGGFSFEDLRELVNWAKRTGQKFVISNSNTDAVRMLFEVENLNIELVEAPRRIRNQPPVLEILARNF